jgi:hypothetical protein
MEQSSLETGKRTAKESFWSLLLLTAVFSLTMFTLYAVTPISVGREALPYLFSEMMVLFLLVYHYQHTIIKNKFLFFGCIVDYGLGLPIFWYIIFELYGLGTIFQQYPETRWFAPLVLFNHPIMVQICMRLFSSSDENGASE